MTALPPIADLTGASITEAQAKTWFSNLRGYLSGLFGDDGNITTALAALGSIFAAVTAKSGAYTVATNDRGTLLNCTGTWTLTLLAAATAGNGFVVSVANTGSGVITIDANASELIDGSLTITVPANTSIVLVCDGTGWVRVGNFDYDRYNYAAGSTAIVQIAEELATGFSSFGTILPAGYPPITPIRTLGQGGYVSDDPYKGAYYWVADKPGEATFSVDVAKDGSNAVIRWCKNGTALESEITHSSTTYGTYTKTVAFEAGDCISVQVRDASSSAAALSKNFKVLIG